MKVAVVTGGNKGIGFAIVKDLCKKFDGTVYLTARDINRGQAAVAQLNKLGLKPNFHQLDVSDSESITKFHDYLKNKYGGLDILVNNAAIGFSRDAPEPFSEQAVKTVGVNFFDLLAICHALFPLLRPHARVVNVSSSEGHLLKIPGQELRNKFSSPTLSEDELVKLVKQFVEAAKRGDHAKDGWPNSTYQVSKVAVSALTFIQQRSFSQDSRPDLVVNAVHPGYVDTDMTNHNGPLTIEQGAEAPVFCALLPANVASPCGQYVWNNCQEVDWVHGPTPAPY